MPKLTQAPTSPTPNHNGDSPAVVWIKERKLFVAGTSLTLAAFLLILWFWINTPAGQQTTQSETLIPHAKNLPYSLGVVSFTGKVFTPPEELSLYRLETTTLTLEDLADRIALNRQLRPDPKFKNTWINTATNEHLILSEREQKISLNAQEIDRTQPFTGNRLLSAEIESIARQNLQSLGLPTINSLTMVNVEYLDDSYEPKSATPSQSALIRASFEQQLGGYPVQLDGNTLSRLFLTMLPNGNLVKAEIYPFFVEPKATTTHPTIPLSEAVKNLSKDQQFSVLDLQQTEGPAQTFYEFSQTEFKSVILEYRLVSEKQQYFPYYRFSGQAFPARGPAFDIQVITPAAELE